jgi:Fe-S-cluster containining protein
MVTKSDCEPGLRALRQPVLPLAAIVQFLFLTGEFGSVEEVLDQLPAQIETAYAVYDHPMAVLYPYAEFFRPLIELKAGRTMGRIVVDGDSRPVGAIEAASALVAQDILTRELEGINSLLCAPCACTLCCTGPDRGMAQTYFTIPLQWQETDRFPLRRIDSPEARIAHPEDDRSLVVDGLPFDQHSSPLLVHWQQGWSLVLPRGSRCPHLEQGSGRCLIYQGRPEVCRRPQIFPYVLEEVVSGGEVAYRLRHSLLAIVDCPYVRLLKEEIAAYAAACELDMVFRHNKA